MLSICRYFNYIIQKYWLKKGGGVHCAKKIIGYNRIKQYAVLSAHDLDGTFAHKWHPVS